MKSSFTYTTATALRGFAGWIAGRGGEALPEVEHVPFVVSVCGYRAAESEAPAEFSETGERRNRWAPGLSLDNFS
jgi:hypothetical protein